MPLAKDTQSVSAPLGTLYQKAQINEAIFHKFQRLELHLLGARTLRGLLHLLFSELKETLMLNHIRIILYDPEEVIRNLLIDEKTTPNETKNLVLTDQHTKLRVRFDNNLTPQICQIPFKKNSNHDTHAFQPVGSKLNLPLIRQNYLIGCLELVSNDPNRFSETDGTLFLEHLAQIVAVCIENSVNMSQAKLLSLRDSLTGVYNRRYFEDRLQEEINLALKEGLQLSCMFLDIDHFKMINDRYGHITGDHVLKTTADIIRSSLRKTDTLARYGGEEFIVILPRTDLNQALNITERLRRNVNLQNHEHQGNFFHVTLSAGLSTFCPQIVDSACPLACAKQLIEQADKALYQAKENGRNQVVQAYYCHAHQK